MTTPPQSYRRTQFGRAMAYSGLPGLAIALVMWFLVGPTALFVAAVMAGVLVLVLLLFGCLTVEIAGGHLRIRFGVGLVRKSWALDQVDRCRPVRNSWLYGWGIRKIPGGWLYNVSGLDAVELKMKSGKMVRIGTGEPQALSAAIEEALGALDPSDSPGP